MLEPHPKRWRFLHLLEVIFYPTVPAKLMPLTQWLERTSLINGHSNELEETRISAFCGDINLSLEQSPSIKWKSPPINPFYSVITTTICTLKDTFLASPILYLYASRTWRREISLLRYNLTDRETLQSYKLNYFIKERVMFLTWSDS